MHYLIVRQTANKAPIWFHEGLSKYEETRWRDGPSYLRRYQTLRACPGGRKVDRFEQWSRPHQADTPEDTQLAYAQGPLP
jgi:hypothetical protein